MLPIHQLIWHERRAKVAPVRVPEPTEGMEDPEQIRAYVEACEWGGPTSALQLYHLQQLSTLIRPGDTVLDLACGPGTCEPAEGARCGLPPAPRAVSAFRAALGERCSFEGGPAPVACPTPCEGGIACEAGLVCVARAWVLPSPLHPEYLATEGVCLTACDPCAAPTGCPAAQECYAHGGPRLGVCSPSCDATPCPDSLDCFVIPNDTRTWHVCIRDGEQPYDGLCAEDRNCEAGLRCAPYRQTAYKACSL